MDKNRSFGKKNNRIYGKEVENLLIELYISALSARPGKQIEFWDPTGDTVALFDELEKIWSFKENFHD